VEINQCAYKGVEGAICPITGYIEGGYSVKYTGMIHSAGSVEKDRFGSVEIYVDPEHITPLYGNSQIKLSTEGSVVN
jgi:hypothetical protein